MPGRTYNKDSVRLGISRLYQEFARCLSECVKHIRMVPVDTFLRLIVHLNMVSQKKRTPPRRKRPNKIYWYAT